MKNSFGYLLESGLGLLRASYIKAKRAIILFLVIVLTAGPILVLNETAVAAQITHRQVTISSGVAAATGVTYTFSFEPGTAGNVQSMSFQSCTTAVGSCTAPTGINLQTGSATLTSGFQGTTTGLAQNTTNTTTIPCTATTNLCLNWTDTTAQNTTTAHVITVTGETNQNASNCSGAANCTFFIRMNTYSDTAYATLVDSGNVASATTQTFTVNAIVEEILSFCVGAVNGASATVETVTYAIPACASLTGSSLNLGDLTFADYSVSPVPTTQPANGDQNNGVVELNTNAGNGSTISYNAIQQSGTNHDGALRVPGATCAVGTSFTDQCINSLGASNATITAGTEDFGMAVTGINCNNVPSGVYTCNSTTHNLSVNTNYNCNSTDATTSFSSFDAGGQNTGTTTCKYAWDETGASETVATSSSVVGGEAMLVEFAATPEVTTPTGAYTAQANFVATPQY